MDLLYSGAVSVAVAILSYVLQSLIKENKKLKQQKESALEKKEKALEEGVVCLLRAKLMEYHTQHMKAGVISANDYENWSHMYSAYKGLGGNGMIEHMEDDIERLQLHHGKEAN